MRYFVTGATGFIGGRLVRQLVSAGHEVSALVRDPERARDLERLGVQVHAGDITDADCLRQPMQAADGVFHVAAWYDVGAGNKKVAERINVGGTRNVLEAMRDLRIRKGVYTSTVGIFSNTNGALPDESYRRGGPWLTKYDHTKWKAHYEVAEPMMRQGLPLVVLQPGIVYGPGDRSMVHRSLVQYLRRKLPLAPRDAAYCFTHVEDIARVHVQAMERGTAGENYITSGPLHSFLEFFALAEDLTGIPAPRLQLGTAAMRFLAGFARVLGAVVPLPPEYAYESLRVLAGVTYAGNDAKARRELGFAPRPLEVGLRETLLYEMKQLGLPLPE